jgi:hypothetical protein
MAMPRGASQVSEIDSAWHRAAFAVARRTDGFARYMALRQRVVVLMVRARIRASDISHVCDTHFDNNCVLFWRIKNGRKPSVCRLVSIRLPGVV